MSAAPFAIRTSRTTDGTLQCEIWNVAAGIVLKVFRGRTAKRRAMFWIEALQVGYFTKGKT